MFDLRLSQWIRCAVACALLASFAVCSLVNSSDPPLDELEQQAFQAAADYVQDCVVQVETFGGLEIVNQQLVASGPSTGTVLSPDGWIMTSMFQFRGQPASITVVLPDEQRRAAKLVARDHSRELALLKIDIDKPLKAAVASNKGDWRIGQWTIALGKTFDFRVASRSVGILSAQGRIFNKAIQTDAKISPQNYGGPLIDLRGNVMGILAPINAGIATEGEVEQWYDSGIGFAIPLEDILERLPKMQRGEDIHPGKAGFRASSPDEFAPEIVLSGVTPGSPAAKAGMKAGDRIIGAGSSRASLRPVSMHSELKHVMGTIDVEQGLVLEVERDGAKKQFEFALVKELPIYREPFFGIVIDPVSPQSAPRVIAVLPNSPAAKAGIEIGDTIVSVAGANVDDKNQLDARLAFLDYREPIDIQVRYDDKPARTIQVALATQPDQDFEWKSVKVEPPKDAAESKAAKGTVQLPLGDVKNKAFAIVPSNYSDALPYGLMLVYADAGAQEPKVWSDAWDLFAREHRWIVVIAQSADEKAWSFEEVELAGRLRSYMTTTYKIDRRRMCIGGLASGMLPAYISAMQGIESYRGVWLGNGKMSPRIRILQAEPLKSLHFFVNGPDPSLGGFVEIAKKNGHTVMFQNEEWKTANVVDSQVLGQLQRWMRLLEAH
ncbi:MAG: PDZ domain-containing protein [Pirellula sp.]